MEFLKYFKSYILTEAEGFGNNYFQVKKEDKSYNYYFRVGDQTDEERGFIIKMGKFSKNDIITDAESNYCVMSIEEIEPGDMEDFLVNEAPYKSRENEMVAITAEELSKISEILEKIFDDYLDKNPKVTKIYDEFLENLDMNKEEYINYSKNTISIWSKGRWSSQDGSNDKSILYTKISHN